MDVLIGFWSHALAAFLFAALMIWRLGDAARQPEQRLLAGAFAITACWAWLAAVAPAAPVLTFAESARNLVWVSLMYSLSSAGEERQHGLKLVYAAVAAVIGLQFIGDTLQLSAPSGMLAQTALVLRITTAAGALVLVHNIYGQAAPASRSHIRFAMLGLALFSTALAYIAFFKISASAGPSNVMLVTLLIPITATALGVLLLGETLTKQQIAGALIIASGLVVVDGRVMARLRGASVA